MAKDNSLSKLQQDIKDLAEKFNFNWSDYVQYIHLVEEVAELGEALTVKKRDRKSGSGESALADHASMKEEIGDVLFTIIQIANQSNLKVEDIMEETFQRYHKKLAKLKRNN